MKRLFGMVKEFLKEEKGSTPEYAGLLVLGAIAAVGLGKYFAGKVKSTSSAGGAKLDAASGFSY